MQITKCASYKSLANKVADRILQKLESIDQPVFCVASGDSPKGLYKKLVERYRKELFDPSGWYFLGLDEWVGLDRTDEGSCRHTLEKKLFNPLNIEKEQIYFFDGKADNLMKECKRIEFFINSYGPIDLAVLGLGLNGHVGFNEPGTSFKSRSHIAELSDMTKVVGQKYFPQKKHLSKGITLGLSNLMETKHLVLIASGQKKASVVREAIEEDVSEEFPITSLRKHPDFEVYLDNDAASLLYSN